ncbi:transposase [Streptomyces sp. NPDC091280]|uniref:transposase n=1 Tax=Streptomyces sp. NPDC091280 TaxID=3365984 RepID=UPI0037F92C91
MRKAGGPDTGPSPVDRRKTGSEHHLICDGRGTPLKVVTTAANANDVTRTVALVDGVPPVAGRTGRPRRRRRSHRGGQGHWVETAAPHGARRPDGVTRLRQPTCYCK